MAVPIRVGVLNDMSEGPPGPTDIERWLRLACNDLFSNGRMDCEVEFVHSWGLGLPSGTAAAVERARSEYMFHLQVGSHEDESIVLARYAEHPGLHETNSCPTLEMYARVASRKQGASWE